ncbi:MAG: hypothetical protein WBZ36_05335, partial [Candidatus Nitrosopolaris sp.]
TRQWMMINGVRTALFFALLFSSIFSLSFNAASSEYVKVQKPPNFDIGIYSINFRKLWNTRNYCYDCIVLVSAVE